MSGQTYPYSKLLHTPLGLAECDLIWVPDTADYMSEYHCWIQETNEVWWFPQSVVRQVASMTGLHHDQHSDIYLSDAMFESYWRHILRHRQSPFYQRALNRSNLPS